VRFLENNGNGDEGCDGGNVVMTLATNNGDNNWW
jgi:hypothetical protein